MAETGHRVLVVKPSNRAHAGPWPDRRGRDLTYLALPAIARHATQSSVEGGRRGLQ